MILTSCLRGHRSTPSALPMPGTNGSTPLLKAIQEAYEQKQRKKTKVQASITRSMRQRRKGANLSLRESHPDNSDASPSNTVPKRAAAAQRRPSSTSKAKRKHQTDTELAGEAATAAESSRGLQIGIQTVSMAKEEPASGSAGPATPPPHPDTTCSQPRESSNAASASAQPLESAPPSQSNPNGLAASDSRPAVSFRTREPTAISKFDAATVNTGAASTGSASLLAPVQGARSSTTGMSHVQPELPSAAARQATIQHAAASSSAAGINAAQQGVSKAAARPAPPQQAAPGPAGTASDDQQGTSRGLQLPWHPLFPRAAQHDPDAKEAVYQQCDVCSGRHRYQSCVACSACLLTSLYDGAGEDRSSDAAMRAEAIQMLVNNGVEPSRAPSCLDLVDKQDFNSAEE